VFRDGELLVPSAEPTVGERRKLAFAGIVSVALAVDTAGKLASDPEVATAGLPRLTSDGEPFDEVILDVVEDTFEAMNKAKRRDPEAVKQAIERAVRGSVNQEWDKKPTCHVLVVTV
jgi:ribonuclease J